MGWCFNDSFTEGSSGYPRFKNDHANIEGLLGFMLEIELGKMAVHHSCECELLGIIGCNFGLWTVFTASGSDFGIGLTEPLHIAKVDIPGTFNSGAIIETYDTKFILDGRLTSAEDGCWGESKLSILN